MKHFIKFIAITAVLSLTYACSDELLDNSGQAGKSQPVSSLTSAAAGDAALTNSNVTAAFVNGIYGQMIQTGTGGTTSQQDFGHKAYHIYSDMISGDMALSQSVFGWYRNDIAGLQAMTDFTQNENLMPWGYYYKIIRSANNVINNLGGNDFTPSIDANKHAMGQAKALRAHSYFYLTQFYQREYNGAEAILPLYIEPATTNEPKSSAAAIYDQMEKDLGEAISLLNGFNRTAKNQVNQDVARMMLALVLGARGTDWPQMVTLTQDVINAGNHVIQPSTQVTNGFANVADPSWMWGIDLTTTIGLNLVSWWGQIDAYSFSYGWAGDYKVIDDALYAQIAANDARKVQFLNSPASSRHLQPLFKFYGSGTIGGSSRITTADYVYMRIEEAYLLNAESNARVGNDAAARISLKALMQNRIPDVTYIDALSGQALIDEIYLQTRIELWGEGKSYFALKRNKATVTRGNNHLAFKGVSFPYNDERLTFEIPIEEIQDNPFISDQNQ